MRVSSWPAIATTVALLGACHAAAPTNTAATAPIPGPTETPLGAGLWVERVSDHQSRTTTRFCLDDATAAKLSASARSLDDKCQKHDMAQDASGTWRFSTQCDMGAWGKVASEGSAKGDFTRHYTVEALTQTVGASEISANGPRRILADVSWQGACPADMKPGDVVLPDGRRSHLSELGASS